MSYEVLFDGLTDVLFDGLTYVLTDAPSKISPPEWPLLPCTLTS